MTPEERIQVWNSLKEDAKTIGTFEPEPNGDSIEDLDEEEAQDKYDLLVELLERPRRIGRI
jgi:hypothetical protein